MVDVLHRTEPIDWQGVDARIVSMYAGKVSAVCRTLEECQDLVAFFGGPAHAEFQPYLPILIVVPPALGGVSPYGTPTAIEVVGAGVTTVAELRDICVYQWERTQERFAQNGGQLFDFDALREKAGIQTRAQGDAAIREAMRDAANIHKRNPRTNPGRDPMRETYPRKSFPVSEGDSSWPL